MATTSNISINPSRVDIFEGSKIDRAAALKASQVLQENHKQHHIFFSARGLHNHIVHHILTVLALGATAEEIERHYMKNKTYQRPPGGSLPAIIERLSDPETFKKYMRDNSHYSEFIVFFRNEIESKGYEAVVNRWLFEGNELANAMLERFMIFHPLIHLGCGLEFNQPALILEALAETAVSTPSVEDFLSFTQEKAISAGNPSTKSLVQILQEVSIDGKIISVTTWDEPNKFENGIGVGPEQVKEKMAELINGAEFVAAASQFPSKIVKLDFFLIHGLTTCHHLLVLLEQPWISEANKAHLVAYSSRLLVAILPLVGLPTLNLAEITDYIPEHPDDGNWSHLVKRVMDVPDDGHTSKVIHALMHGQKVCKL